MSWLIFLILILNAFCQVYIQNDANLVKRLQEYLRLRTYPSDVRPDAIEEAVSFWRRESALLGLAFEVYRPASKPLVVISLPGSRPDLPSIVMNSHMDVVGVQEDEWSTDPFAGTISPDGTIYGRGAQDTKTLAIQQFEVLRYYIESNTRPMRTLHMTLMPDEETGGFEGMKAFVLTEDFKRLNIGFVLDEGVSNEASHFLATYVDKRPWQMHYKLSGESGHSAKIISDIAVKKMSTFLDEVLEFRDEQQNIQLANSTDYGAFTTVNVNLIRAGIALNVVPSSVELWVDIRLAVDANITQLEEKVEGWLQRNGGDNSTMRFIRKETVNYFTAVDDSNPFWVAMQNFAKAMGTEILPIVCPATSDMIYIRSLGIPAIGFAPITNTTSRMHGNDEYIQRETFLRGVYYYRELIKLVTSVP